VQEESRARIRSFAGGINHQRGGGVKSARRVGVYAFISARALMRLANSQIIKQPLPHTRLRNVCVCMASEK
jgi:hypothetical protein